MQKPIITPTNQVHFVIHCYTKVKHRAIVLVSNTKMQKLQAFNNKYLQVQYKKILWSNTMDFWNLIQEVYILKQINCRKSI